MKTCLALAALAIAAGAGCSGGRPRAAAGQLVLTVEGAVERGPYRFGTDDLPRLERRAFEATPPATGRVVRFDGVDASSLLLGVVEPAEDADVAVVHGTRGYAVPVPLAAIRQLRPVLADKVNGAATAAWSEGAGPLQLAWPNVDEPGIDTDPRMRWWWVGGVSKIELRSWVATYGRALRVPPGSTDAARLGAEAIALSCTGCHRVRGTGGTRGPELSDVLVRRDGEGFAERMRDHLRRATGVASAPEVSPTTSRQIAAFLRAVVLAGHAPEDELPSPEGPPVPAPLAPRPPFGR